jgi:hypothetical protein
MMKKPISQFRQLNMGWNAHPTTPKAVVKIQGEDVLLGFVLNHVLFRNFKEGSVGLLKFSKCMRYRLGPTNDEGWSFGQCRFSGLAPQWGEFYEVTGDARLERAPNDWVDVNLSLPGKRHFLFYLKDHTFEAAAEGWSFHLL